MKINQIKKGILFCLFILFSLPSFSQDLIVTNQGDTLNCRIRRFSKTKLIFNMPGNKAEQNLKTDQFRYYRVGYFKEQPYSEKNPNGQYYSFEDYDRVRFAVTGGFSFMLGKVDSKLGREAKKHVEGLLTGGNISLDFLAFTGRSFGLGVKYGYFSSSNSTNFIDLGVIEEQIKITYIGLNFAMRTFDSKQKNSFIFGGGLGYLGWVDEVSSYRYEETLERATLGLNLDMGYDIKFNDHLGIGLQLSCIIGSVKMGPGSSDDAANNLSRIDLGVGLRFFK